MCWICNAPRKPRANQSPTGWAIWRALAIQENMFVNADGYANEYVNIVCPPPRWPATLPCAVLPEPGKQHTIPNTISDLAPMLEKLSQTTLRPPWQPKVQALGAKSAQPTSHCKLADPRVSKLSSKPRGSPRHNNHTTITGQSHLPVETLTLHTTNKTH